MEEYYLSVHQLELKVFDRALDDPQKKDLDPDPDPNL